MSTDGADQVSKNLWKIEELGSDALRLSRASIVAGDLAEKGKRPSMASLHFQHAYILAAFSKQLRECSILLQQAMIQSEVWDGQ